MTSGNRGVGEKRYNGGCCGPGCTRIPTGVFFGVKTDPSDDTFSPGFRYIPSLKIGFILRIVMRPDPDFKNRKRDNDRDRKKTRNNRDLFLIAELDPGSVLL